MSKRIQLSMWAERRYATPPSGRTLRRWVREHRISPIPQKHGRAYYVKPEAVYFDENDTTPLLERVFGKVEEIQAPTMPAIYFYKQSFEVLPVEDLRRLPKVTTDAKCSGLYFLWEAYALAYIGEAVNIYRRCREHATQDHKPFTHATFLELPPVVESAFHRRWCEEQYVQHYSPRWNRTRHG